MKRIIVKLHTRRGRKVIPHSRLIKALKNKRYKMGSHKKKLYKKLRSWTPEEEEELNEVYGEGFDPDAGEWKY